MNSRENICSQQIHCLSCPISVRVTGKDCRELMQEEIKYYMKKRKSKRYKIKERIKCARWNSDQLRKLKTQGLVVNDSYGGQTEDGEVFCIHGFTVTEKAEKTEEYIKAYNEERELCKRTLDIDIGEMKK